MCQIALDSDTYNKDWSCGRTSKRDLKWDDVPDNWHGFLLTWEVQLYADTWISATAGPQSSFTHWGHVFWPRPYLRKRKANTQDVGFQNEANTQDEDDSDAKIIGDVKETTIDVFQIGNGLMKEKLSVSAHLKRNGGYWHDMKLNFVYGDDISQDMEAYQITSEGLAPYDQTEVGRVYEGLISAKQASAPKAKKAKQEL